MANFLINAVGLLCLGLTLAAAVFMARTGVSEKNQTYTCRHCGYQIPYREFAKQHCPRCGLNAPVSSREHNRNARNNKFKRFCYTLLIGLFVTAFIVMRLQSMFGVS